MHQTFQFYSYLYLEGIFRGVYHTDLCNILFLQTSFFFLAVVSTLSMNMDLLDNKTEIFKIPSHKNFYF